MSIWDDYQDGDYDADDYRVDFYEDEITSEDLFGPHMLIRSENINSALNALQLKPKNPQTNTTAIPEKASTSKASESNDSEPTCSKAEEIPEDDRKLASSAEMFEIPKPVKVERQDDILNDLLNSFSENIDGEFTEMIKNRNVYELKELPPSNSDYCITKATFDGSMQSGTQAKCRGYQVKKIEKVRCPYLVAQFQLRGKMKGTVFEQEVYHGTKRANIAPICKENFDWRKSGTHFGTKFGRGVSFAKYPTRATFYPKTFEFPRAMLVSKIMYVSKQIGRTGMRVPDDDYDATTCDKDEVIVKYDDAEFLPLFVIYYS